MDFFSIFVAIVMTALEYFKDGDDEHVEMNNEEAHAAKMSAELSAAGAGKEEEVGTLGFLCAHPNILLSLKNQRNNTFLLLGDILLRRRQPNQLVLASVHGENSLRGHEPVCIGKRM